MVTRINDSEQDKIDEIKKTLDRKFDRGEN